MKVDKIDREMQKTREKITVLQNRLKELDAQKTEAENLQIVQLVRSMRMTPQELKAFLSGDYQQDDQPEAAPVVADTYMSRYSDEQEDIEDEE